MAICIKSRLDPYSDEYLEYLGQVAMEFNSDAIQQHLILVILVPGRGHRMQLRDLLLVLELQGVETAMT